MSKQDFNKQLEKRQRIKKKTLVVGIDIGAEFNAVALMSKEGEIFGEYTKIYNSRKGLDYFVEIIEKMKTRKGLKEVLLGFQPTGHYWRKIAYFAKDKGYQIQFNRTTALKHQRELDESSSAKSDQKDALTIGNITREGKYIDTVIENDVFRQLRTISKVREKVLRHGTSSQNTLSAVFDDYFPELKKIFSSMKIHSLWALLKICPFPQDVLKFKISTITEIVSKSSRRRMTAAQKAHKLFEEAKESIGLKQVGEADRYRLKHFLEEVIRYEMLLKEIVQQMKRLLDTVPCSQYLLSIPGVGPVSAAIFLGELGNPEHFTHPK